MTFCVVPHVKIKGNGLIYVCTRCGKTFTWQEFRDKGGKTNSEFKKKGQEFAQRHRGCVGDL